MTENNEVVGLYCDILSSITVLLSFFHKLPQIFKISKQKSVAGLSLFSLFLELGSYTLTAGYNYAKDYSLMSYLEYPILSIQELILIYLYFTYCRDSSLKSALLAILVCFLCGLLGGCICAGEMPPEILELSVIVSTSISLFSKFLQLQKIWRVKSADSVSVSTWFFSTFRNSARLYTTMMNSADIILLINFGFSTVLSVSIMLSAQHFQNEVDMKSKKAS